MKQSPRRSEHRVDQVRPGLGERAPELHGQILGGPRL
jgi:hypothetical protein